ncbi:hypothetical protein MHZ92_11470 [Sporosarcina sp. ACRSL]|uniref:hypothetical protein n=1 Tax=Sporosarcina sp. ACRSL TaxID=2918215 RepID=UPI001EF68E84|nr:hypothetical protein [Sporosarcina sp. ACRSL]MCG7344757.1 hypothetical protein [Sporosarcina sp. ACRSL]
MEKKFDPKNIPSDILQKSYDLTKMANKAIQQYSEIIEFKKALDTRTEKIQGWLDLQIEGITQILTTEYFTGKAKEELMEAKRVAILAKRALEQRAE